MSGLELFFRVGTTVCGVLLFGYVVWLSYFRGDRAEHERHARSILDDVDVG